MLRINDTLDGERVFEPLEPPKVRMYVCGITPYDRMHVGHLRTYVFFDVVRRYLEYLGYEVMYVQNITDIEDKVFRRAKELGIHPLDLTRKNMEIALKEMDRVNIRRPDILAAVSDNIPAIQRLIGKIMERGYAYEAGGDVYFSVRKFKDYGKLSKQKLDQLIAGARIEPGEHKRDPLDFVLWKAEKEGELVYDSPWGRGRPGWHIECSAISMKYLGETIDIHGGGRDLIFPHHENEIAQSEAATGKRFVRYWMHTGFLTINGEKMSKSLGNFITVGDLLDRHDPNAVRLYLLSVHYRSPIDFKDEYVEEAAANLERIRAALEFARVAMEEDGSDTSLDEAIRKEKANFINSMDNDFDTSGALAALNALVHEVNKAAHNLNTKREVMQRAVDTVYEFLSILGIEVKLMKDSKILPGLKGLAKEYGIEGDDVHTIVSGLLERRAEARKRKDFETADKIRSQLIQCGIIVEDFGGRSTWRRK